MARVCKVCYHVNIRNVEWAEKLVNIWVKSPTGLVCPGTRAVLNSTRGLHQDMGLNLAQSILNDKQLWQANVQINVKIYCVWEEGLLMHLFFLMNWGSWCILYQMYSWKRCCGFDIWRLIWQKIVRANIFFFITSLQCIETC